MEITFNGPTEIVVVSEVKKIFNSITIIDLLDNPQTKKVSALTKEIGRVILWEGTAYDAIGQWTETDVINRIKELYEN